MKIVHVISGLRVGGAESMLERLLATVDRSRFESEVLALTDGGPIGERIAAAGIPVRSAGMRGVGAVAGVVRLVSMLRHAAPDVVQTWLYHADLLGGVAARLATRAPVVWNIRHSDLDPVTGRMRHLVAACARLSRKVPERIVSCSEVARRIHEKQGYAPDRFVVIPNGFDPRRFRPDAAARSSMRGELGVPADVPLVGIVARWHPQKDHATFLRAAAALRTRRPDARFVLCGPWMTPENLPLAAAIEREGLGDACLLVGRRSDVERVYAAIDVLCSSSAFGEGFPNVLGEAMACGVPCVATDVGDSALVVGSTGRTVPPRDPAALAAALDDLLALPAERRRRLGLEARRRIEDRFDLDAIARLYESLWCEVAGVEFAPPHVASRAGGAVS